MIKSGNVLLNLPHTLFTRNNTSSFKDKSEEKNLTSFDEGTDIKMDRRFSPNNPRIV